jgi:hypothetical protein
MSQKEKPMRYIKEGSKDAVNPPETAVAHLLKLPSTSCEFPFGIPAGITTSHPLSSGEKITLGYSTENAYYSMCEDFPQPFTPFPMQFFCAVRIQVVHTEMKITNQEVHIHQKKRRCLTRKEWGERPSYREKHGAI